MEGALVLLFSLIGLAVFFSPIVSLIGFFRTRQLRETVEGLQATVAGLDARVEGLTRAQARLREQLATAPPAVADPATAPMPRPAAPAPVVPVATPHVAPAAGPVVIPPGAPVPIDILPPGRPLAPPPAVQPLPAVQPPAAVQPPPGMPPGPPPPPPVSAPLAAPPPLPAAAARPPRITAPASPAPPDAGAGVVPPPRPPFTPPPAPPAEPPAAAFDWESMLGIRGAAWLAGITLVIAALLFAKWSIDQGFFTPVIRVALLAIAGTGALVWAELGLRKGYEPTADAISGAGIVTLYVTWFAAHTLYGLIDLMPAFVGMCAVTTIAAVISVRHGALFTAILGLIGGLATPLLLASGTDNPRGLFAYLAVLNIGFLFVARRQAWTSITAIALAGTTAIQFAWTALSLTEEKLPIALLAYAVLGGVYLWHALATQEGDDVSTSHALGFVGAAIPYVAAIVFAADPRFVDAVAGSSAPQWWLVLGNIVVLDAVAIGVGLWRLRPLVATSAVTTALAVAIWAIHVHKVGDIVAPAMVVLALTAIYNLLGRLSPDTAPDGSRPMLSLLGASGIAVAGGLYLFTLITFALATPPPLLVIGIIGLLFLVFVERSTVDVAPLLLPAGAVLLGVLARVWFERAAVEGVYVGLLSAGHVIAVAFAIVATIRSRVIEGADTEWWMRADLATLAATGVAYAGLHGAIDQAIFAAPGPVFGFALLDLALVLLVAIRLGWTALIPLSAAAGWLVAAAWHVQRFTPETASIAVAAEIAIYATFVVLPFLLTSVRPAVWRYAVGSWLTSALIGPAFFVIFRSAWIQAWGTETIGLLAVGLAAVSVASLAGIGRIFSAATPDPAEAARRLNYLALFSTVALGFVAAAIAMQLEKQWITIGWALEGAAVFWVFGLVPHPGLKYLGMLFFAAVGVRLLANDQVLQYEPRGAPIVNWLLYTYGVPVLCTFAGAWFLRRAEERRPEAGEYDWMAGDRTAIGPGVAGLGLILLFWLINLEIADYYSTGRYVQLDVLLGIDDVGAQLRLQRNLTRSIAWGLYALGLLSLGLWRGIRGLRLASLLFLLLTVGKVFVYDLSVLEGIYRILSFVGLGVALIIFSLLYQRFFRKADG
jgi:uncharacterized membrane protein